MDIPHAVSFLPFLGIPQCSPIALDRHSPATFEDAVGLLELSDYLDMDHLRDHMIDHITNTPTAGILPSTRIYLARTYRILDQPWIASAFSELLHHTSRSLTTADVNNIGSAILPELLAALETLKGHRTTLAVKAPPAVHGAPDVCPLSSRPDCSKAWMEYWRDFIGPKLNHATDPWCGTDVLQAVKSARDGPWRMKCLSCTLRTADSIHQARALIMADVTFIQVNSEQLALLI